MSEEMPEQDPSAPPQLTPEEQEMLEQQMREIRIEDILAQTVASLLNLSARRIVKDDEVDLDQARTGIEAVRVLRDLLPPEVAEAVQEPLSQVQLLYAQRAGTQEGEPGQGDAASGDAAPGGAPGAGAPAAEQEPPQQQRPPGPKLWTPGRD